MLMIPAIRWWIFALPLTLLHGQIRNSDPGGVLSRFAVARFAGLGNESIQAMTSDTAGNVYVAGTTSSPDLPMKNAAQPQMGEVLLMRSVDRGVTWQKVPQPGVLPVTITPHPSDPLTLFVGAIDGIYKTGDGGLTWRHVYTCPSCVFSRIAIDPADPRRIYAAGGAVYPSPGFLTSGDGGETWQPRPMPVNGSSPLWVDPNGSGTVGFGRSLSKDHGLTWTSMTALPMGYPSFTIPDPHHPGWIYAATAAGTSGRLYRSTNWGATWVERPSPTLGESFQLGISQLLFDPDLPNTLYATAFLSGLQISDDAGATWRTPGGLWTCPQK